MINNYQYRKKYVELSKMRNYFAKIKREMLEKERKVKEEKEKGEKKWKKNGK